MMIGALVPMLVTGAVAREPLPLRTALQKPAPRCGWVVNPTPGNWWLTDRDGDWIMAMQGGYETAGMENIPDLTTREWVANNGNYGYACGCISGSFDPKRMKVARIDKYQRKPLAACRSDRKLPKPE
jgi:hypothetical protein